MTKNLLNFPVTCDPVGKLIQAGERIISSHTRTSPEVIGADADAARNLTIIGMVVTHVDYITTGHVLKLSVRFRL